MKKILTPYCIVLFYLYSSGILFAQDGAWIEYSLDDFGNGQHMYDCGDNCCAYTRETSQYILIFDTANDDWLKTDLGAEQSFQYIQNKGSVSLIWSDELLFAYSSLTNEWDTIHCEDPPLRESYQQLFRSYGCSNNLAFFVSDKLFYVFDAKLGYWQQYDYGLPSDFISGQFYPHDDYIMFLLLTSDYYGDVKNVVYSSHTGSFNMIDQGCRQTQQNYDHGYAGIRDKTGSGDEFLLVGYSAFDNEFDVINYLTADTENAINFFPSSDLNADTIISYCIGFRKSIISSDMIELKYYGYSTILGEWDTITYEIDHSVDSYYGNGMLGGQFTVDANTNADSKWYFFFYTAINGFFERINTDLLYTSTTSALRIGGSVFCVNDADHVWCYNPVTGNGNLQELSQENNANFLAAGNYASLGRWSESSEMMHIHFYNSSSNRWSVTNVQKNTSQSPLKTPHLYIFLERENNEAIVYSAGLDSIVRLNFSNDDYVYYKANDKLAYFRTEDQTTLVNVGNCSVYEKGFKSQEQGLGKRSVAFYDKSNNTLHGYSSISDKWTTITVPEEPSSVWENDCIGLVTAWLNSNLYGKFYAYNALADSWVDIEPEGTPVAYELGERSALLIRSTHVYAFNPFGSDDVNDISDDLSPSGFSLNQNYPNPFNSSTIITYTLASPSKVVLKIFNSFGQEIYTLVDELQAPGEWSVAWDGKNISKQPAGPGIYFYQLKAGSVIKSRKMTMIGQY